MESPNLVYLEKRYISDQSPMCVYLPSNEILFKMMRACLGCDEVEDLWIYEPQEEKTVPSFINTPVKVPTSNEKE